MPTALASAPNGQVIEGWLIDEATGEGIVGADVWLFNESVTETEEQMSAVGQTTTGFDGYFKISKAVTSADVAAANANGGWVNFDLAAESGELLIYEGFSRSPDLATNT